MKTSFWRNYSKLFHILKIQNNLTIFAGAVMDGLLIKLLIKRATTNCISQYDTTDVFVSTNKMCHPLTRCIKKIADQPCYNAISTLFSELFFL